MNLDISGFKASINNTNTTQNKQLQTLFEGIDALKKEACQHTLTGSTSLEKLPYKLTFDSIRILIRRYI